MDFKVKEVTGVEDKSVAQIEEQLLKKHEEKMEGAKPEVNVVEPKPEAVEKVESSTPVPETTPLNDEDVLSYIKDRYNIRKRVFFRSIQIGQDLATVCRSLIRDTFRKIDGQMCYTCQSSQACQRWETFKKVTNIFTNQGFPKQI